MHERLQEEIRLEDLEPDTIKSRFRHKNLLIPKNEVNVSKMEKKCDLWISHLKPVS